jgi:acyl-CoA reductase-like NAD-dependent aldehyde dehydrogenase
MEQTRCTNPATGELLGYSPLNTTQQVRQAVAAAREAQPAWAALPIGQRRAALKNVREYLCDTADELAEIIARDNGKTRTDAMAAEILPAVMAVDYYCRKARSFLRDKRLGPASWLLANKAAKLVRAPYGVVGIISPWNYPFSIPFSEVVMALLAGNAVILKVATQTQMVGRAIERCIQAAALPPGLFTHVNLPGPQAGEAFLEAGVDKLFFTGSVAVGQALMARAARTLTPLVLELGGNDPMLVCPDADLARAAAGAVWAGLQNCGQSCGGVERIYVHRSVYRPFLDELAGRVKKLRIGYDTDYQVDLGAMTTTAQLMEVRRQVEAAVQAGARIYAQSSMPAGNQGNFLPAMILTEVDHRMEIMRLETFGPVLGVMPVDDMEQALALANDCDLGLTASVWTRSPSQGERLARRIKAGVVTINDHLMTHGLPQTPWGGFKHSGLGRTHGAAGMAEMTQVQCLVHDLMPGIRKNFWWHPHGPQVYQGLRGVIDFLYAESLGQRLWGLKRLLRAFPRTFKP